jgi:hypothetical protein
MQKPTVFTSNTLFSNVNQTLDHPLQPVDTTFIRDYSCEERHLRAPAILLIFVITANYALIIGAYQVIIWIAQRRQKRRQDGEFQKQSGW